MTKPIANKTTPSKPAASSTKTKSASKPAPKTAAKPAKPNVAANKFIRVSNTTYTKLLDLQLGRTRKEGRRVSLGEVVSDLISKKK